jgi:hypothetical protein
VGLFHHSKKLFDYFKCLKHTGQRAITHHTTSSHRIGFLYTHTPLIGMCRTVFLSPNGVQQTFCVQEAISANWPCTGTKYWVGIKPMTWDSQSQTWTTQLVDFSTMVLIMAIVKGSCYQINIVSPWCLTDFSYCSKPAYLGHLPWLTIIFKKLCLHCSHYSRSFVDPRPATKDWFRGSQKF